MTGVNHRTAPIGVRERLAPAGSEAGDVVAALRAGTGLAEAVLLSTCNRVEVYGVTAAGESTRDPLAWLAERRGVNPALLAGHAYRRTGAAAARHCFQVASGLDSMVPGDAQVLGQVKDAFDCARRQGAAGPSLHALFEHAFATAKRVRTRTGIGRGAVSVPWAAVELARQVHGDLARTAALLLGAGDTGQLAARNLVASGVRSLLVANRTWARAAELARAVGGAPVPFERWTEHLASVDVVVTATGSPAPVVTRALVEPAIATRRSRPLVFIDIAVPRDVEPGVAEVPQVACFDLDALERLLAGNLAARRHESGRAEAIVAEEVERFAARHREREVVPVITSIRSALEQISQQELRKALARLPGATPETRRAIESLSSALVNKIAHFPTARLHEAARAGAGADWSAAIQGLWSPTPHGGPAGHPSTSRNGPPARCVRT